MPARVTFVSGSCIVCEGPGMIGLSGGLAGEPVRLLAPWGWFLPAVSGVIRSLIECVAPGVR